MAPKRSAPSQPPAPAAASGSSEESEEEGVSQPPPPAAPKSPSPPPQNGRESESSGEDDEDSDYEEEDKVHEISSSATKNLQPDREESESSGEEEEHGTDGGAPQPKRVKGGKRSPKEGKKAAATSGGNWSKEEEISILEALTAYRRERGKLPRPSALAAALAGALDVDGRDVQRKVKRLRNRYNSAATDVGVTSKGHARRVFDLSRDVWGAFGGRREFGEMRALYPILAETVESLDASHPGLFKSVFPLMDDGTARELEARMKKQKVEEVKMEVRGYELTRCVMKVLMPTLDD